MWIREVIKSRAKSVLKVSYWKAFLVSLIFAFVGGSNGQLNLSINNIFGDDTTSNLIESTSKLFIVFSVIAFVLFITLLAIAFRIFVGYALEVGAIRYFIQSTQYDFDLNSLGFSFSKSRYWDIVIAMLWRFH
ncbi:hypothetical protein [Tepidibacillus marianensis]|uniref:hypothetical protein n=1 Tax=Tepidibacillus marianensis TaxID=3131995 RepID=UPI0030CE6BF6